MLIVNADDWGRSKAATDTALACFQRGRISSTSAMVFMMDSARGAKLANDVGIDVGLHINFSEAFSGSGVPEELRQSHDRIRRFLKANKYALLFYHPFLRQEFAAVFQAQANEFLRLFGKAPSHMDGHQHMHLCSNMLFQGLIPEGVRVRRSFSFGPGQKSIANRLYRSWVDRLLRMKHHTTDFFFALSQHLPVARLRSVAELARQHSVELMTHPQVSREYDCLMSDEYADVIADVPLRTYSCLPLPTCAA
jgi:chitin disaccharide deacetylase